MWENISASLPLIAGAAGLFLVFCTALMVFEKRSEKRKGTFRSKDRRNTAACG